MTAFTASTGNPSDHTLVGNPVSPGNPAGVITIQNTGSNDVTVTGQVQSSGSWGTLGTVAAGTIGGITMLPGLTHVRLSSTDTEGVIVLPQG